MTDLSLLRRLVVAPPEVLEEVACALCGADNAKLLYTKKTPAGEIFPIVRCRACDLVYVNPRRKAEALSDLYRDAGYFRTGERAGSGYADYIADRELHLALFRRQLDRIEERAERGTILDVGCAMGFLLEEARRRGWETAGVELSPFASAFARDRLGLDVRTGTLREAGFPESRFDAAILDDVVEHFGDPAAELRELARVVKPRGVVLFKTPNAASPWHRLMGKHWVHMKPGEHLYYFTPRTLSALLAKSGFETLYARACGKPTHLLYMAGRVESYHQGTGRIVQALARRFPFSRRPFSFRSGEMEVAAMRS